jgi:nitrogen fixation protein FixH
MKKTSIITTILVLLIGLLLAACGGGAVSGMKKLADQKVNDNLTITLSSADGKLKYGDQELLLSFTDGTGKPVEIAAASLNFHMPAMGSMAEMNDTATLNTTATAGEFKGNVNIQMAGEWIAQISYEGKETGKTTMKVTAY